MEKKIVVYAAENQETLDRRGADVDEVCDTIAQAKKRAKYFLTEDFMHACETTTRLGYSQVVVNGEVHSDFFGETPEAQYSAQLHDEREEYRMMDRHGNG